MKLKIFIILICAICSQPLIAQNITNTLGLNGIFSIKDGSTTFLTLHQTSGLIGITKNITLADAPGQQTGILYKGSERFLHNYQPSGTEGYNTFLGIKSGNFTMSGTGNQCSYNTALGYFSLYSNTTGQQNTAVGMNSLYSNTSGYFNTATGMGSLFSNTTGGENTAVGHSSLSGNTTGYDNTAVGYASLTSNTTGYYNTALGSGSLLSTSTGYENTAVGYGSLLNNTTGNNNTALGTYSLYYNNTGSSNTALGTYSMQTNTIGIQNTAVGVNTLYSNTSGYRNTALGVSSMYSNTTGAENIAMGFFSMISNTTGSGNTALGNMSGLDITTGNNLTCVGYGSNPSLGSASNQVTLGNNSVTSLRCNVTTITSLSDSRDKKNITDLNLGINFLMKLKPRLYNWDKREWYDDNVSDGTKMQEEPTAGFIAQELDEAQTSENAQWLNLVLKNNPEKWEATPGNLLPVMVKAIQELKTENDELKKEIESLKTVEERLAKLEQVMIEQKGATEVKLTENKP